MGGVPESSFPTFPVSRYVLVISSGSDGEGSMNYMTTCGETQCGVWVAVGVA